MDNILVALFVHIYRKLKVHDTPFLFIEIMCYNCFKNVIKWGKFANDFDAVQRLIYFLDIAKVSTLTEFYLLMQDCLLCRYFTHLAFFKANFVLSPELYYLRYSSQIICLQSVALHLISLANHTKRLVRSSVCSRYLHLIPLASHTKRLVRSSVCSRYLHLILLANHTKRLVRSSVCSCYLHLIPLANHTKRLGKISIRCFPV